MSSDNKSSHETSHNSDDNSEIHKKALDRFEIILNREREQRDLAVEDREFINEESGQWHDEELELRSGIRPSYQVDRTSGAVDQVVGDQRESRRSIKVLPRVNDSDEDTADVFNGLIRSIESDSHATNIYDAAYTESVSGGYGGWRVLTEFNEDDMFEQDVVIKPVPSAESSLYFGPSEEYDKRDAPYAYLVKNIGLETFKDKWPEATVSDFSSEPYQHSRCDGWFSEDEIRIAEYWLKVPTMKTIALMSNKQVIYLEDEKEALDEMLLAGIEILEERPVEVDKILRYVINGAEILEGPEEWLGKFFPLIPLFGKTTEIRGKSYVSGLVRKAKDPQRIYNWTVSTNIESMALTPKDPFWYTNKQAVGNKTQWESFTRKNSSFLPYNHDSEQPGPPIRSGPPSVNSAGVQLSQEAASDIYATTGIEPASLGNVPKLESGKAILAQQAMGDRGTFIYNDNLSKSIAYTGEILVDLIQKIYDRPRIIRIIKPDESTEVASINQEVFDRQTEKTVIVNDLTKGKYDVSISSGPSYSTKRRESAQQLIELATSSPIIQELALDLIVKNLDIVENDEITERVRKRLISTGTVEATDDEKKKFGLDNQQPDPTQEALLDNVLLQNTKLEADIENKDADTQAKLIDSQQSTIESLSKMIDALNNQVQAGLPVSPQQQDNLVKQNDLVAESQQTTLEGPNTEQTAELAQGLPVQGPPAQGPPEDLTQVQR